MWSEDGIIEKEEALESLRNLNDLIVRFHLALNILGQSIHEDGDQWMINERAKKVVELKYEINKFFAFPYYTEDGELGTFASSPPVSMN